MIKNTCLELMDENWNMAPSMKDTVTTHLLPMSTTLKPNFRKGTLDSFEWLLFFLIFEHLQD